MQRDPKQNPQDRPFLIGICGGSGAGKTRMAGFLQERFPKDVAIISQDSYYKDLGPLTPEEKSRVNFDHPDAFDNVQLVRDLDALASSVPVSVPTYDFVAAYRTGSYLVHPQRLIIVEGLFLLHMEHFRQRLDFKIFVEADESVRVRRIKYKDLVQRKQPEPLVELKICKFVLPMHQQFIQPFCKCADIVVNNSADDLLILRHSVDMIVSQIESRCQSRKDQAPLLQVPSMSARGKHVL